MLTVAQILIDVSSISPMRHWCQLWQINSSYQSSTSPSDRNGQLLYFSSITLFVAVVFAAFLVRNSRRRRLSLSHVRAGVPAFAELAGIMFWHFMQ